MSAREHRNDVMHAAFMAADVGCALTAPLVRECMNSLRKYTPSQFGGWRMVREEEKGNGKRSRKRGVS